MVVSAQHLNKLREYKKYPAAGYPIHPPIFYVWHMADPHRRRLRPPVRLTLVDVSPDLAEHEAACATATAPPLPAALAEALGAGGMGCTRAAGAPPPPPPPAASRTVAGRLRGLLVGPGEGDGGGGTGGADGAAGGAAGGAGERVAREVVRFRLPGDRCLAAASVLLMRQARLAVIHMQERE